MDFAPYQDASPDTNRALSPPPRRSNSTSPIPRAASSPRASLQQPRSIGTAAVHPHSLQPQAQHPDRAGAWSPAPGADPERAWGGLPSPRWGVGSGAAAGGREDLDMFSTRLGIRMDYEACLAYLLLPPAGGVLLLIIEHRSDYVRFHAWQSSLLFTFLFVVHVVFAWSTWISWLLLAVDLFLIALLTYHAYKDADTLDRFEVPFFGPLASSILDDE